MRKIKVQSGQTAWDVALQEYGSFKGFFWLIDDNPSVFNDLNAILNNGTELYIREEFIDKDILKYYTTNIIKPANAITPEELALIGITINGAFDMGFNDGFEIGEGELAGALNEGFMEAFEIFSLQGG